MNVKLWCFFLALACVTLFTVSFIGASGSLIYKLTFVHTITAKTEEHTPEIEKRKRAM